MKLTLSERLSMNQARNPSRSNLHLPAFLALKEEIRQAINDGWTKHQIWSTLYEENKLVCSYVWFLNLCRRYVADDPVERNRAGAMPNRQGADSNSNGFNYHASYNKEELI
ncbi:TraK family protein [Nitrosomonas aestuarii]|uniref:TraK family protein n=1 Tax=Nitrosomonas aestuarii TaxID=52441 RepID=UPI000D307582|nr:TraK family protein [Nitrosomonas aestuarii]PTN09682.1 hypothetical protein C8R11_12222 [Nitrosomonas aestuarii]